MGSKNKLRRFEDNERFENVVQPTREDAIKGISMKGKWAREMFGNNNPIVLELGCGKGEYTTGMAEEFPEKNFIGIDIKGARFWRGAKTALEEGLKNVAFIRTQIELVDLIFEENEVSEIWITFPDPQIKYKRTKHRLTNEAFLRKYHHILNENGTMHLKTDSEFMHGYTLGILQGQKQEITYANHRIYQTSGVPEFVTKIQTFYEKQYLKDNKPITYIQFKLRY